MKPSILHTSACKRRLVICHLCVGELCSKSGCELRGPVSQMFLCLGGLHVRKELAFIFASELSEDESLHNMTNRWNINMANSCSLAF